MKNHLARSFKHSVCGVKKRKICPSASTNDLIGFFYAGPNAVLTRSKEGYSWASLNAREVAEMVTFRLGLIQPTLTVFSLPRGFSLNVTA